MDTMDHDLCEEDSASLDSDCDLQVRHLRATWFSKLH